MGLSILSSVEAHKAEERRGGRRRRRVHKHSRLVRLDGAAVVGAHHITRIWP